jgi:ribonuclease HI
MQKANIALERLSSAKNVLVVSGSRIGLNDYMCRGIARLVRDAARFGWLLLVGDAEGVDKEVIRVADELSTPVICVGMTELPRNGGSKQADSYIIPQKVDDRRGYAARDRWMIRQAHKFVGIWNGTSRGTPNAFNTAKRLGLREGGALFRFAPGAEPVGYFPGTLPIVTILTDGSCRPNPGRGGWAAMLRCVDTGDTKEIAGTVPNATNQRMELIAVIEALRELKTRCEVNLVTDSSYVYHGFESIPAWSAKDWRKVANADLWQTLAALMHNQDLRPHFVPESERSNYDEELVNAFNSVHKMALAAARA